ncbi:hypothetical protein B9G98_03361 [Wickerhamiella sorbophila]|uniref:Uncharacterized protein n=1 Tax=Wickerhamiella sorbophila TaxID=45607 RepID=A0A2T0FL69_9ASCO|nr:hypothetical protein B9G98_03361 [Wickerhamiella sorbophila]PRT55741.1 hypothetical protein B9G98_03361 [Wickerhamiella sorbophila]
MDPLRRKPKKVYDACAGRIRNTVQDKTYAMIHDDMKQPVGPDDVLLEVPNIDYVPVIESSDLPNSDLMTAIHYYASEYYRKTGNEEMYESLDGTALIAIAVALEESIKERLGETGHLQWAEDENENQSMDDLPLAESSSEEQVEEEAQSSSSED